MAIWLLKWGGVLACGAAVMTTLGSVVATFLWYILAAMQSPAATAASQKDHWNPADNITVRVMPDNNGIGNVLVVDPTKGILKFSTA